MKKEEERGMKTMKRSGIYRVGAAFMAALMVVTCMPQTSLYASAEETDYADPVSGEEELNTVPSTTFSEEGTGNIINPAGDPEHKEQAAGLMTSDTVMPLADTNDPDPTPVKPVITVTGVTVSGGSNTLEKDANTVLFAAVTVTSSDGNQDAVYDGQVGWTIDTAGASAVDIQDLGRADSGDHKGQYRVRVTGKAAGTATITATAGDKSDSCTVTVVVSASRITLDRDRLELTEGGAAAQLTATILPEDTTDKTLTWTSSKPAYATVSQNGTVTPVAEGECDITVTTANGKTASCHVVVNRKPTYITGITINPEFVGTDGSKVNQITVGQRLYLANGITLAPETGINRNTKLRYTSSNPDFVSVDENSGVVTGLQVMSDTAVATITITALGSDPTKAPVTKTVKVAVVRTPVTKITLRRNGNEVSELSLTAGDVVNFEAEVTPRDATNPALKWTFADTKNTGVATVENGILTAVNEGEGTLTVTSVSDPTVKAECKVTVEELVIRVQSISLDRSSAELAEGEELTLTAVIRPDDASNKKVSWSSSDETVATVDENGKVTATGAAGESCVIRAVSADGGRTASCTVKIIPGEKPVAGITLSDTEMVLGRGSEKELTATVTPEDATNRKVLWEVSNRSIAKVSDGTGETITVTALNEGTCTITAKHGDITASCELTVAKEGIVVTPETLRYAKSDQMTREKLIEAVSVTYFKLENGGWVEEDVRDSCAFALLGKDQYTELDIEYTSDNEWAEALATPGELKLRIRFTDRNSEVYEKTVVVTITERPPAKLRWVAKIPKQWNVINGTSFAALPLQEWVQIEVTDETGYVEKRRADVLWDRSKTASGVYVPSIKDREQTFTMAGTVVLPDDVIVETDENGVPKISLAVTQEVHVQEASTGGKVSRIVPSIPSGSKVARNEKLELTTDIEGAVIYYTTDGRKATRTEKRYADSGYITLTKNTPVIRAIAVKPGWQDSPEEIFYYTVDETLVPDEGEEPEPDQVTPEDKEQVGGKVPDGLWAAVQGSEDVTNGVASFAYTGKAINPVVHVYDHTRLLTANKDYTVSYQNNKNAADANGSVKPPTITITGKGNYEGKALVHFTITRKSIEDEDVLMNENLAVSYTGKNQKPSFALNWNGTKLAKNRDYTYQDIAYKEAGQYSITVTGMGNYEGERTLTYEICDVGVLVSKLTFSKIPDQMYNDGKAVCPDVTVSYKNKKVVTPLVKDYNYTITYVNNKKVGTASAVITGLGNYKGEKRINFKIKPIANINQAGITMTFDQKPPVYTGTPITPNECKVFYQPKNAPVRELVEGTDYTVVYQNNNKVGTATAVFTGIGAYTGTVKKTFKIQAENIAQLKVNMGSSFPYQKDGCKPKPEVVFGDKLLKEGTDYTLTYKNHNKISDTASVTVKGKGNFKGSVVKYFSVTTQDIGNLQIVAADKVFQRKANIYKTSVKVVDVNGKVLKAGSDYSKDITYTYADGAKQGQPIMPREIIPEGTKIQVEVRVTNPGRYQGKIYGTYRIVKANISNARVTVTPQDYTGRKVKPGKNQITVTMNGMPLNDNEYEITGYANNVNQGTAKLTIRGLGNYGGTKTVNFKIRKRGILGLKF